MTFKSITSFILKNVIRVALLLTALSFPPIVMTQTFVSIADTPASEVNFHRGEKFNPDYCNWYCHNRNCDHEPRILPEILANNHGAFGATILALRYAGQMTGLGYKGINILVFCVIWPALTFTLYTVASIRAIWSLV